MDNNQQLERTGDHTPAVITTAEEYTAAMKRWEGRFNVLTPFTSMAGIPASYGLVATVVKINLDPAGGEVYAGVTADGRPAMPFLKGKQGAPDQEFALAKVGLRKLGECYGISTDSLRLDPMTIPNYWYFKGIATYRGLDGSTVTRTATFEWDLRDGSDRLKGWTPNQITEGRKNGLRNCEARAINAAIRECGCGIRQKYTRAELDKPFVVVRVSFQPDMKDPEIKRMVTQRAIDGANSLYPATPRPQLPSMEEGAVDVSSSDPAPRHVGSSSTVPTTSSTSAPTKPDPDVPPVEGAVRIVDVQSKSGDKNGRKWTRFQIIDSLGVEHSTFDKSIADIAQKAKETRQWVEVTEEADGQYRNLVEIGPAGESPKLPGMDEV